MKIKIDIEIDVPDGPHCSYCPGQTSDNGYPSCGTFRALLRHSKMKHDDYIKCDACLLACAKSLRGE